MAKAYDATPVGAVRVGDPAKFQPPGPPRRATGGTGTGLTPEEQALLAAAVGVEDDDWDIATEYAERTLVKRNGVWYRLPYVDGSSPSTGDDPEDGAPWEVFALTEAAGGARPRGFFWSALSMNVAPFAFSAIASGTAGFTASALSGVMYLITSASTDDVLSGATLGTTASMWMIEGLNIDAKFQTPASLTNKGYRLGCGNWANNNSTAPTDGMYLEVAGTTATLRVRNTSNSTDHTSTATLSVSTLYRLTIERAAASTAMTLYDADDVVLLTGVIAAVPVASGAILARLGEVAWDSDPGGATQSTFGLVEYQAWVA